MTNVGIDVAKEVHWVCAVDTHGTPLLNHKLRNSPGELQALVDELHRLPAPIRVGIDLLGGIASLIQASILEAGFELPHIPGIAVNRAREGTTGGEAKSVAMRGQLPIWCAPVETCARLLQTAKLTSSCGCSFLDAGT